MVANDDGSVTVTPSADPDVTKTTVTYTDENGDSHTVTFTKDDSGNWVDDNPNDSITVDPKTGVITIPEDAVKDGSDVTATNTDSSDNAGPSDTDTVAPAAPSVSINDGNDGKINQGDLNSTGDATATIAIPSNAKNGDTLVVTINGVQQTYTIDDNNRTNGIVVSFIPLPNGQNNIVTAVIQSGGLSSDTDSDSSVTELSNPGLSITVTDIVGSNLNLSTGIKTSEYGTHIGSVDLSTDESLAPRFSEADDTLTVTKNMSGNLNFVDMGAGDNVLNVGGYVSDTTQINFGNGADEVNIAGYVGGSSVINLGDGNDTISIEGALQGSARINAGAGNDSITIGQHAVTATGSIDGGAGYDVLTFTQDFTTSTNVGNLKKISGVEEIALAGNNQVLLGVTYDNLIYNSKSLYISGDSNDKVHLGNQTGNLNDYVNGQVTTWSATGTVTKDGNVYTEYTLGADTSYKVYIDSDITIL